jgi:hypothetical protein
MTIRAHFDGRTWVPDEPLNLPMDCQVELEVRRVVEQKGEVTTPLQELVARWAEIPDNPDWPADGAMQLNAYVLAGVPWVIQLEQSGSTGFSSSHFGRRTALRRSLCVPRPK